MDTLSKRLRDKFIGWEHAMVHESAPVVIFVLEPAEWAEDYRQVFIESRLDEFELEAEDSR